MCLNKIEKEFVLARMEALDSRLRNDEEYCQQAKLSNQVGKRFQDACNKGVGVWKAYCDYEEELSKTNCIYSEESYKLGFEDASGLMGMEKEPDGRKSVLSLKDMTALVAIYDSVKELKGTMLGSKEEYWEEGGVLAVFESVQDILRNSACAEIRLMGQDEAFERLINILGRKATPEERAKELLGL